MSYPEQEKQHSELLFEEPDTNYQGHRQRKRRNHRGDCFDDFSGEGVAVQDGSPAIVLLFKAAPSAVLINRRTKSIMPLKGTRRNTMILSPLGQGLTFAVGFPRPGPCSREPKDQTVVGARAVGTAK
jgi:hypothetical protein